MEKSITLSGLVDTEDDIEIGQWYKQVGDTFQAEDVLLEVISNKATFDIALGVSGTLLSILHSDGEVVSLNDPIATIDTPG